jgi:hypothetical protein
MNSALCHFLPEAVFPTPPIAVLPMDAICMAPPFAPYKADSARSFTLLALLTASAPPPPSRLRWRRSTSSSASMVMEPSDMLDA